MCWKLWGKKRNIAKHQKLKDYDEQSHMTASLQGDHCLMAVLLYYLKSICKIEKWFQLATHPFSIQEAENETKNMNEMSKKKTKKKKRKKLVEDVWKEIKTQQRWKVGYVNTKKNIVSKHTLAYKHQMFTKFCKQLWSHSILAFHFLFSLVFDIFHLFH